MRSRMTNRRETRGGIVYRKFRGWNGNTWWVAEEKSAVLERALYRATVVITPLITIWGLAWVAGMLK